MYQIDRADTRDRVVEFLNTIGIPTRYVAGARGFIEGCRIERGTLAVDPECKVSGLLHEAGHLSITPPMFRPLMDGNITSGQREMLRVLGESNLHPDDSLYRAVIQCSDPEATAWAWAAGRYLGLPGEEIIRADEYDGEGESIRVSLQVGAYIGIHGLAHAGFCAVRSRPGVVGWPSLKFWTQCAEMPAINEPL